MRANEIQTFIFPPALLSHPATFLTHLYLPDTLCGVMSMLTLQPTKQSFVGKCAITLPLCFLYTGQELVMWPIGSLRRYGVNNVCFTIVTGRCVTRDHVVHLHRLRGPLCLCKSPWVFLLFLSECIEGTNVIRPNGVCYLLLRYCTTGEGRFQFYTQQSRLIHSKVHAMATQKARRSSEVSNEAPSESGKRVGNECRRPHHLMVLYFCAAS